MSPKNGIGIRGPRSGIRDPWSGIRTAGKDSTSVGRSARRYCELSFRLCASVTSAIATLPRAAGGRVEASHRASPPSRIGRPRPSVTLTCNRGRVLVSRPARWPAILLAGSTVGFVRLDDLLHERMPHHVFFVEVNERDALDVAHDLHNFDEARLPRGRQIDLRDISGDDGL